MKVHIHSNCQAVPIGGMLREVRPEWLPGLVGRCAVICQSSGRDTACGCERESFELAAAIRLDTPTGGAFVSPHFCVSV